MTRMGGIFTDVGDEEANRGILWRVSQGNRRSFVKLKSGVSRSSTGQGKVTTVLGLSIVEDGDTNFGGGMGALKRDFKMLEVDRVTSSKSVYFRDLSVTFQKLYLHRLSGLVKRNGCD
jgi:hypothetical protein